MQTIKVCLVEDIKEVREGMETLLTLDKRFEVLASYADAESAAEDIYLPVMQIS